MSGHTKESAAMLRSADPTESAERRMPWNYMQIEISDHPRVHPLIGYGHLTREAAHAEIQTILDQGAEIDSALTPVAALWRRGAEDDTVFHRNFTWTIYEHPEGEDPRKAALQWLEGYAETMRAAGAPNVQVARWPE